MSNKLIGEDMSLSIVIGNNYDGTLDPWNGGVVSGTATNILGSAKRVSIDDSLQRVNLKALGDARNKNRYHSAQANLEIETFVPAAGYDIGFAALGKYITVNHDPLSGFGTPVAWTGVITDWKYSGAVGQEQSVTITIDLDPDHLT